MKKASLIIFTSLLANFTCWGQIKRDTLFYKNAEIRIYTYLLEGDTIAKAYFDENIPRNINKINTNLGKMTRDLTFESIADFVRIKYPKASITATNINTGELIKYDKNKTPKTNSAITTDCYWIDSINHFSQKIKIDSSNYIDFYEYANSLIAYYGTTSPWINDKLVVIIDKCIALNNQFEDAYMLKAKVHEDNGIWKGIIESEPHVDVVNINEIDKAINCLGKLLILNPQNEEAKKYILKLNNKYKK